MILSTMKTYALAIAAAVGSALLIALRVLSGQNRRLKAKNKRMEAQREHTLQILRQDTAIDEQTDTHLAELAKEVEDGKHPSELTDPNKLWNDKGTK